jgi:CheY-like chemotaxis protein
VVDDEASIREAAQAVLEAYGYSVMTASGGSRQKAESSKQKAVSRKQEAGGAGRRTGPGISEDNMR